MPTNDSSPPGPTPIPPSESSPKRLPWWRRNSIALMLSGILILGAGLGYRTDKKLDAIENRQANVEWSMGQHLQNERAFDLTNHSAVDDTEVDLLLSMIPDARQILEARKADEKRAELEKRLMSAWDLLQKAKKRPKDDLLDCHRVQTMMIDIGDRADALRIQVEKSTKGDELVRIGVPLERIQAKASLGTKIAWKQFPIHADKGVGTEEVLEGGGLIAGVLEWSATLLRSRQ